MSIQSCASKTIPQFFAIAALVLMIAPIAQAEIHVTGDNRSNTISLQERTSRIQPSGNIHMDAQSRDRNTSSTSTTCDTCTYRAF